MTTNMDNTQNQELNDEEITLVNGALTDVENADKFIPCTDNTSEEITECEVDMDENNVVSFRPEIKQNKKNILELDNDDLEKDSTASFSSAIDKLGSVINNKDISEEDSAAIFSLMVRRKRGEKINCYKEMPECLREIVRKVALEIGASAQLNFVAENILDEFISEAAIDKEFIDLQKSIEETLQIPSLMDFYLDHIKDVMEKNIIELADRIKNDYPEKAALLNEVSNAFKNTYTMEALLDFMKKDRKARNRITKDLKDYNIFCRDHNRKMNDSRFVINDVNLLLDSIKEVLPEIEEDNIKKFIIIFCKQCKDFDIKSIPQNSYIYYFIKNIISLKYLDSKKTDFSIELINNIKMAIDEIIKTENAYNEYIKNRKK